MGTITIFARMGVKPENVEKLTALAAEACKVAAEEPGTLTYDWHYAEEHGSLVLLETYADSSAHLSHMQADGHGELMGGLMALIESLEFLVLGEPTAEHAEAGPPSRERSSTQRSRASSFVSQRVVRVRSAHLPSWRIASARRPQGTFPHTCAGGWGVSGL